MWCGTLCGAHEAETLTLAQAQVQGQGPLELDPQQVLQTLALVQVELSAEAQRLVLQREPGQVLQELQELESQQGARAGS